MDSSSSSDSEGSRSLLLPNSDDVLGGELVRRQPLTFDSWDDERLLLKTRFQKSQLVELKALLGIPDTISLEKRTFFGGEEALMLALWRLSYATRLHDICEAFHIDTPFASRVFNHVLKHINQFIERKGLFLAPSDLLISSAGRFAEAIRLKTSNFLVDTIGFVDGTLKPICRPSFNQSEMYSGHKRWHGFKFEALVTPDGLIVHLFGPAPGRCADSGIYANSGLLASLTRLEAATGRRFKIAGDRGYPGSEYLFRETIATRENPLIRQFRQSRCSVEWAFGKVSNLFGLSNFKRSSKILLQPAGLYYRVSVFLTNVQTCYNGSQVGTWFGVDPPAASEYLA